MTIAERAVRPKGRIFTLRTLCEKGIRYHPNHIRRLVKRGKFPAPFYLSERTPAWCESTIDAWLDQLEAARPNINRRREITHATQ
jgi:predicted DNA-binding transcriptional regulator AlpA